MHEPNCKALSPIPPINFQMNSFQFSCAVVIRPDDVLQPLESNLALLIISRSAVAEVSERGTRHQVVSRVAVRRWRAAGDPATAPTSERHWPRRAALCLCAHAQAPGLFPHRVTRASLLNKAVNLRSAGRRNGWFLFPRWHGDGAPTAAAAAALARSGGEGRRGRWRFSGGEGEGEDRE